MTASRYPSAARVLRLECVTDGGMESWLLDPGRYVLGGDPESDIVVTGEGVSRRHALLEVAGGRVEVEDLGSKNGTWVDARRVGRAEVRPGSVLQLGRVVLSLAEVTRGDAELALELDASEAASLASVGDTGTLTQAIRDTAWARTLAEALRHLYPPSPDALERALEAVRSDLTATAVALLEVAGSRPPRVVTAVGRIADLAAVAAVAARGAAAGRDRPRRGVERLADGREVAWGAPEGAEGGTARSLLVASRAAPLPESAPLLLEVLAPVLLAVASPATTALGPAPRPRSDLVFPPGYVVGTSAAAVQLHAQLATLLAGDAPVLVSGETGTGKELAVRILHASSPRVGGPLVAVNCAAIPAELLESELFGIREGVATGVTARPGKVRLADGGILFLDEIGELPASLQAKLLRVLQEREVEPVGARRPERVDIRLVSATNSDLERRVADGRFRADLYYRIAGVQLELPPLRLRREDIPALVRHFLTTFAREAGRRVRGVSVDALAALQAAPWPGNIRELQNQIRRLVHRCPDGGAIESSLLPASLEPARHAASSSLDLHLRTAELETELLREALARAEGNRSEAARLLGLSRNGLAAKLRRHGLDAG